MALTPSGNAEKMAESIVGHGCEKVLTEAAARRNSFVGA
jgi:hypothetical protein